jgi:hypothetical protein
VESPLLESPPQMLRQISLGVDRNEALPMGSCTLGELASPRFRFCQENWDIAVTIFHETAQARKGVHHNVPSSANLSRNTHNPGDGPGLSLGRVCLISLSEKFRVFCILEMLVVEVAGLPSSDELCWGPTLPVVSIFLDLMCVSQDKYISETPEALPQHSTPSQFPRSPSLSWRTILRRIVGFLLFLLGFLLSRFHHEPGCPEEPI